MFWLGFLSGFLANWVFGMATRLLPAKWVRYRVQIGILQREEAMGFRDYTVTVHIQPPTLKRALMEPLREYLLVQVKLGNKDWLPSKWVEGDVNTFRLLADAAMSVSALVFTEDGGSIYLADNYPEKAIFQDGGYDMWVRVIRSLDGMVADEVGIAVIKLGGRVTASTVRRQNKSSSELK